MTNYKLDQGVAEFFEFELGGFTYKMRYPNGEDRRAMAKVGQALQKAIKRSEDAQKSGDDTEVEEANKDAEKLSDEMTALINGLVSCDDEKAPKVGDALEKAPTPVIRNFQDMIQAELSMETPIKK